MAKMVKGTFTAKKTTGIEKVSGYLFDLLLADNTVKRMGVYKGGDGKWYVIDTESGLSLCNGPNRKDAVARAESEPMVKRFTETLNKQKPAPKAEKPKAPKPKAPSKKPSNEEPSIVDLIVELQKVSKELEDIKSGKMDEAFAKKAEELFGGELKARIEEELDGIIDGLKVEQADELPDMAGTVSLDCILEEMQEWCKDKPNVSAYRKNKQPSTPVRVAGETKPYQEELSEMGFRWSQKGFWYMGQRELARRA